MFDSEKYSVNPIGVVRSTLVSGDEAPAQGFEGAPEAVLEVYPKFEEALEGLAPGMTLVVLTWFHESRREVLQVHPRGNPQNPLTGVFATRSPNRPNPIGLHTVEILAVESRQKIRVRPLEAIDGTPIIDIKPAIRTCS